VPGALWNRARLEELRWPVYKSVPELRRVVIGIDPAVASGEDANETGIIVAGYRQHKADRIEKRRELAGIIDELQRQVDQHRADLTHIDGVLRVLASDGPGEDKTKTRLSAHSVRRGRRSNRRKF
jgi:phage terminase large subunit-like protein